MANEQVTGQIGGEDVVLNNAATEATLEKLLNAVDKQNKPDSEKNKQKESLKSFREKLKEGTESLDNFADAAKSSAKAVGSKIGRDFSHAGDAATGLAEEFVTGSARISDFSSHLTGLINQIPLIGGVLGGPLQLFASFLDNNIDTFRELSTVGIDFGNSIFAAQEAATRSRLALDTFAAVVGENSTSLALLEGNASRGARAFRDVSNRVQRNFIPQFASLGLTMEETAEFTGDFLSTQTRLGRAQEMTQARLSQQTQEYVLELDRLARVTGIQRDQLSEQIKQESADERFQALLSTMSEGAQRTLTTAVATLEQTAGPQAAESFRNMIATFGVPIDEFGAGMTNLNPALSRLAKSLGDETATIQDVFRVFRQTGQMAADTPDDLKRLSGATAAAGNQFLSSIGAFQGLSEIGTNLQETFDEQSEAARSGAKVFAGFESAIVQARNSVLGALVRSDAFVQIEETLANFVDYLTGPGLGTLKRQVRSFSNWFDGWLDKIRNDEGTFGDMLVDLFDKMIDKLSPLFAKLAEAGVTALNTAIKQMFSNPLVSAAIIGFWAGPALISAAVSGITNLFLARSVVNAASTGVGGLFSTMKSSLGRILPNLLKGGAGLVAGTALNFVGNELKESGNTEAGKGVSIAGSAATGAATGAILGSVVPVIGTGMGAAVGGVAGGMYGMYQEYAAPQSSSQNTSRPENSREEMQQASRAQAASSVTDSQLEMQQASRAQAASSVTDSQLERLDKLTGFAPKIDNLSNSIGGFQERFNSIDLNYREIDRTTRSLEQMTEQLQEINTQLAGGEEGFLDKFKNNDNATAGDLLNTANNTGNNQLEDLNRVMKDILGVLLSANNMERKQLAATRQLTGNLYAG